MYTIIIYLAALDDRSDSHMPSVNQIMWTKLAVKLKKKENILLHNE